MARSATGRRIGTAVIATLLSGTVVTTATVLKTSAAGFTAIAPITGNSFNAGAVNLSHNGVASEPMFHRTTRTDGYLNGDQTVTRCVNVTYAGDISGSVRMYIQSITGTQTLAPYLTVRIDRGTGASGGSAWNAGTSCTGFATDAQNSEGLIANVTGSAGATAAVGNTFNGTLATAQASNASYANGLGAWTSGTSGTKSYKITVTVANNNAAKGTVADANMYWEIQTGGTPAS